MFGIRQATSVFRGLRRQKGYIIINIAGLAVGLASAMLIALWVGDELGFDRFHRDSDRIYRIMSEGGKYQWKNMRGTPAPLAEAISREIPEVERAARFATTPRVVFQSGTKAMYEERGLIADPSLFEIFSFPFALSILLVLCTAVLFRQMRFVRNAELGFDKDNVVIVPVKENIGKSYDAFKAALLAEPAVSGVTAQSYMFSDTNWRTTDFDWEGRDPNHIQDLVISPVDADFFETLDMEIVQGRGFSGVRESGGTTAFVLNEAAVKAMRLDAPVGKWFSASRRQGVIVGIVRDAHLRSFRERIEPRVFWVIRSPMEMREGVVLFKIRTPSRRDAPRAVDSALAAARRAWENINAVTPFEFRFLDDHYNSLYKNESRIGALLNIFAGMAVLIAGLGLFGLSSFLAERRTKEIGIRKILGASGPSLLRLMSGEFVRLAAVANVLVWPVGYLAMDKILRNFAYRVRISPIEFAAAALVSLSLAVAAVSAPLRRAAGTDPARALRYE